MEVAIETQWKTKLDVEFKKPYFEKLVNFVRSEYLTQTIYPAPKSIFRAFELCPFDKTSVIILGQDPYHGKGQANGLCFAVGADTPLPPSLVNIYRELEDDLGVKIPSKSGDLARWARQGVLLLNATLTVRANSAGSHQGKGWEEFTDAVISKLSSEKEGLVFILWGNYAKAKGAQIDRSKHLVIESAHPSPLSAYAGFFGSKPFSKANEYLIKCGRKPIEWV